MAALIAANIIDGAVKILDIPRKERGEYDLHTRKARLAEV